MLQCVAVCCSVLQCAAVCCSVLQYDLHLSQSIDQTSLQVNYSVLKCFAVCCSLLQCVAVCCSVLQYDLRESRSINQPLLQVNYSVLKSVEVYCSELQCVAVCCSVTCTESKNRYDTAAGEFFTCDMTQYIYLQQHVTCLMIYINVRYYSFTHYAYQCVEP